MGNFLEGHSPASAENGAEVHSTVGVSLCRAEHMPLQRWWAGCSWARSTVPRAQDSVLKQKERRYIGSIGSWQLS